MGRGRFSIGQMIVAVVCGAWCLAVLREPSEVWSSLSFGLVLAFLGASPILAWAHRGRSRHAWAAFALAGWARFLVSMMPLGPDVTANAPWKPMSMAIRELIPPTIVTYGQIPFRHQTRAVDIILVGLLAAAIVSFAGPREESSSNPS